MTDDSLFLIDVDKILRTKASKHYKYIPKFVTSYLKRIVHQDEINIFLDESKDKVGVDFLEACMDFLDAKTGCILSFPIIRWADKTELRWAMCWGVTMTEK